MKRQAQQQEAAIARTPKATEDSPKPRRSAAKPGTARKTVAKPAAKAGPAPKARPAAKAKPPAKKPAVKTAAPKPVAKKTVAKKPAATAKTAARPRATAPKAAARATPKSAAKTTPKAAPRKAAPKATPQLRASAGAAARRAAAEGPPRPPRPARAPSARKPKVTPALLERLVEAARKSLDDDKAENIVVLDVTGRADYADRLVIATGLADRQIEAMATHLEEAFEKEGLKLRRDSIQGSPDWVLIDAGDLVVHLFKPEARGLYALERMWGPESPSAEAPQDHTPLPDDGTGGSTATEYDDE